MTTLRKNVLTAAMVAMLAVGGAACGGDDAGGEAEVETGTDVGATEAVTEPVGEATEELGEATEELGATEGATPAGG